MFETTNQIVIRNPNVHLFQSMFHVFGMFIIFRTPRRTMINTSRVDSGCFNSRKMTHILYSPVS